MTTHARQITVIDTERAAGGIRVRELWRYRDLLWMFVRRDISVKYKQTLFGVLWAVLQPVVTMVIFAIVFGRLARMPSDGVPYPLFALAGLVPWIYFASAVSFASGSLVSNRQLLTRVFFPRILLPLSSVLSGLVDLGISILVLGTALVAWRVTPTGELVALVPYTALAVVAAFGAGLLVATLNVRFRDVQYAVPFAIQIWLFLTPVVYPASLIPDRYRWLYGMNPMVSVVEGFRWALTDAPPPEPQVLGSSLLTTAVLLVVAIAVFTRLERSLADAI